MNVRDLMAKKVRTCLATHPLTEAARIMWEHDVGAVPVVDTEGRLVGMITDRDICMHAYLSGNRLGDDEVITAMSGDRLVTVQPDDEVEAVARSMELNQLRRLPVTKDGKLMGVISLADLARASGGRRPGLEPLGLARAMAGIARPNGVALSS